MKNAKKVRVLCKPFLVRACTTLGKPPSAPPPPSYLQMDSSSNRYSYEPVLRWNPDVERYFSQAYGAHHFARVSKALTYPSRYSCIRINTLKATVDGVMEKLLAVLKDEGAETSGNMSSVSNGNAVAPAEEDNKDAFIKKCSIPGLNYVVSVQGSGPNTINYESQSGEYPKEVIVSRKCAEAVLRGAQVFVPGVMACSAHVEKGDRVAVSVAIEKRGSSGGWVAPMTRGTVLQGLETDTLYRERHGLYIGQGTTTMSRAGIFRAAEGIAVDMDTRVFSLPSLHDVLEGEIFLQNLPSIITAHALDPKRGEKILDMCAAPGGKTTAVAILMKDEGEVTAVDRSHNKVMNIQKRAAEMGLTCIKTYKMDALKSVREGNVPDSIDMVQSFDSLIFAEGSISSSTTKELISDRMCLQTIEDNNEIMNERIYTSKALTRKAKRKMRNGPGRNQDIGGKVQQSKGFYPGSFDRVLLDAPCSALGLRPRLFAEEETIESLRKHAKYQRRMFDQAVKLVRPGGVIVYSTCTINPGENEALVRYALDTYKFLSLAPQHPKAGGPGLVGRHESEDGFVEEWLRPGEEHLVQRFDPSSPLDTIGFFIAKFAVGAKDVAITNEDG